MLVSGQRVLMGDGSVKMIENLLPGDTVLDWKGNVQTVEGVMCSKIDPIGRKFYKYNQKLTMTETHPMYSVDTNFYCMGNPRQFWITSIQYVGQYFQIKRDYNWGTNIEKIKELTVGTQIASYENEYETITSIEEVVPDDGWAYNHKVSGSGTYVVEGLCVNAWPNERFDYTAWVPLKDSDVVSVIRRKDTGIVEVLVNADLGNLGYEYDVWSNVSNNFVDPATLIPPTVDSPSSNGGLRVVA